MVKHRLSKAQLFIALDHKLSKTLGIYELGIFPLEIEIGDRTGLRAAASDIEVDFVIDRELKQFLQKRHAYSENRRAQTP